MIYSFRKSLLKDKYENNQTWTSNTFFDNVLKGMFLYEIIGNLRIGITLMTSFCTIGTMKKSLHQV